MFIFYQLSRLLGVLVGIAVGSAIAFFGSAWVGSVIDRPDNPAAVVPGYAVIPRDPFSWPRGARNNHESNHRSEAVPGPSSNCPIGAVGPLPSHIRTAGCGQ